MKDLVFETPAKVRLRDGARTRRIVSVQEASDLLESADWPGSERSYIATLVKLRTMRSPDIELWRTLTRPSSWPRGKQAFSLEPSSDDASKPNRIHFERSVRIQPHGGRTVREVKSVNGTCEILIDWPHAKRGPYYQSAHEVMQAALAGKATPDQAREAFTALAAHAGILIEREDE